ncbi:putative YcxB family protein [Hyphomicrobium sp. 1Nfss2.1]|uniref:YcxB family protein n=1 Tax=Hyphomicrobium sp. 1Nfss2.1 TaxID=3413936 RepID=UPI003C7C8F5E
MTEIKFRLEPAHLSAYGRLSSARLEATGAHADGNWGVWLVGTFGAATLIAAASLVFPAVTGNPFAMAEFTAGLVAGVAIFFAIAWWRYLRLSRRATRADGPTRAEHRLSLGEDGLRSSTCFAETLYRWSVFEDVTATEDVVVLWIEPGAGVLVPRNAFACPAAEAAFLEAVRRYMA